MTKITTDDARKMSRQQLVQEIHVRAKKHESGYCGSERRKELRQEMSVLENALMNVDDRDEPPESPRQRDTSFVI